MIGASPFNQISKSKYVESELEKMVRSDQYKEGDKLPSQNDLSTHFQVGTRIIREALKHLEAKGFVSMKQGKGVFVKKQKLDFYLKSITSSISYELPQNRKTLIDLTRTREVLEIQAIHAFIENPDYEILHKLTFLVEEMEKSKEKNLAENYWNLDLEFHRIVVSFMRNDVINYMYKHLADLLLYSITNTEKLYDYSGFSEHQSIIRFLDSGDLEGAVQTIKKHFKRTIRTIQKLDTEKTHKPSI